MTDNSRFTKLRIHQVFEFHLLRAKAAQAEDKGPFIIHVGPGRIGKGLAKRGTCAIFKSGDRMGLRNISEFWKGLYTKYADNSFLFSQKGIIIIRFSETVWDSYQFPLTSVMNGLKFYVLYFLLFFSLCCSCSSVCSPKRKVLFQLLFIHLQDFLHGYLQMKNPWQKFYCKL